MGECSENQRFVLTSPGLYAPLLRRSAKTQAEAVFLRSLLSLKTVAVAAGVRLDDSGIEFLSRVERGEGNPPSTA